MRKYLLLLCWLIAGMMVPALAQETLSHEEERVVKLSDEVLKEFGIRLAEARLREMPRTVELPGEVVADPDRVVHVVPVARGFVREVFKGLGDRVAAGEVLATLDSPELADLKAAYLSARTRLRLAEELFRREKALWEKKITAEESYLRARQELELARIQVKTLAQKLLTLGFSPKEIQGFETGERPLGRYELRSPISGLVVEKHLVRGEMVGPDRLAFQIADLSEVWVLVSVYRKWLPHVKEGQKVRLDFGPELPPREARIDYVNPILQEDTRSARARIRLKNPGGELKPGLLVRVLVDLSGTEKALIVPEGAIQLLEGRPVIFVKKEEGFVPHEVKLGRKHNGWVEVLEGLSPGEIYVAEGALTLKAELEKESLSEGHAH